MAKYRVTAKTFIAPWIYDPETNPEVEVPDNFIPGPHMIPLDAAAKRAYAKYEKDFAEQFGGKPSLNPVEQLPRTVSPPPPASPAAAPQPIVDPVEARRREAEAKAQADAKAEAKP